MVHLALLLTISLTAWHLGANGLEWLFLLAGTATGLGATIVLLRFARTERLSAAALRLRLIALPLL